MTTGRVADAAALAYAERRVIGRVLACDTSMAIDALPDLTSECFADLRHMAIWSAAVDVVADGRPVSPFTVDAELARVGKSVAVGGLAYLGTLVLESGSSANPIDDYVREIRDAAAGRGVRLALADAVERIERNGLVGDEAIDVAERAATVVTRLRAKRTPLRAAIKYRAPELVSIMSERATWPWVSLRIGADRSEIVRARIGQLVVLNGPSGSGKSSLAIEFARRHAEDVGPCVYLSRELDHDEVGGRIVSQRCGSSWEDALTGKVPAAEVERALALPRLVVLALDGATVTKLEAALQELRLADPDAPALIVVDYLQLLDAATGGQDERIRVASIAESLRALAQRLRAVVLAVSQTSRVSSRSLRDGELVGADTTSVGAESAQIERAASITLALGGMKLLEDGRTAVDISIGKGRMGQGDQVRRVIHDGRPGNWEADGPAVSGDERRAEKVDERDGGRIKAAVLAIGALLAKAAEPMSRGMIRGELGIRAKDVTAACRALLTDPASGIVEVRGKRTGGAWPLWSRDLAVSKGIDIVPVGAGSDGR